jgi:hypothetical protein
MTAAEAPHAYAAIQKASARRKAEREVDDDLRRSWARSDTTLRASRF